MTPEMWMTVRIAAMGAVMALAVVALIAVLLAASRGEAGKLGEAITWLQGKKTYILAAAITALEGAGEFGLLDFDRVRKIETFLLIGVIATFRAAVTKVEHATTQTADKPKETP